MCVSASLLLSDGRALLVCFPPHGELFILCNEAAGRFERRSGGYGGIGSEGSGSARRKDERGGIGFVALSCFMLC